MTSTQPGRQPGTRLVLVADSIPGLLARWRRTTDGWEGLVCMVDEEHDFVQQWVPADLIRPAR